MIILISSSGKSKNMINAIKYAKSKKMFTATFTGFEKNNFLNKHGNISFWINSRNYNIIENTHQIWLLTLCDYLAKKEILVKILVTGNLGYIGSVLVEKLINNGNLITGLDCGFYKDCDLYEYVKPQKQIIKDIRLVEKSDLNEIEAIIHLAALSNDPLGELIPGITSEINYTSTIKFAKMAKKEGVKKFIYISSQSMYGISKTSEPLDEDNSQKKPITEYAKTKWSAEIKLRELIDKKFIITFLRPATVFGASPRLRSDIVFNNLLGCAFTSGQIDIKSDGSPIRTSRACSRLMWIYYGGIKST